MGRAFWLGFGATWGVAGALAVMVEVASRLQAARG